MMKIMISGAWLVLSLSVSFNAIADGAGPMSAFTKALAEGTAREPFPLDAHNAKIVAMLQKQTGNDGPLSIYARLVTRFQQQPRCGRIVFAVTQESTGTVWSNLGGQLNICEDGNPPWRTCTSNPTVLIPPNAVCADKSMPVDTPEVRAAIEAAVATGGKPLEDLVKEQHHASAGSAGSAALKGATK